MNEAFPMDRIPSHPDLPTFLADSTLGKLGKWLRSAGLDTLIEKAPPDPLRLKRISDAYGRIVLTRAHAVNSHLAPRQTLWIRFNKPINQVRQVMQAFRIDRSHLRPMARCLICNDLLVSRPKVEMIGLVPDYIWQRHQRFKTCGRCKRIYWQGSHVRRTKALIDQWFKP